MSRLRRSMILCSTLIAILLSVVPVTVQLKECEGDTSCSLSGRMAGDRVAEYREMYNGCEIVQNNLVLAYLNAGDDVSFLANIKEVKGTVILYKNHIESLPLHNLRLIRGNVLFVFRLHTPPTPTPPILETIGNSSSSPMSVITDFMDSGDGRSKNEEAGGGSKKREGKDEGTTGKVEKWQPGCMDREVLEINGRKGILAEAYSLYVVSNIGLKYLEFRSLEAILAGDVSFEGNENTSMGHLQYSINWGYLFSYRNANLKPDFISQKKADEPFACDKSCELVSTGGMGKGFCWGPQPELCQKQTGLKCPQHCPNRCNEHNITQCCDSQCAPGCTGPTNADCLSCRKLNKKGVCVETCNPTSSVIYQPELTLTARSVCVDRCPDEMVELRLKDRTETCFVECPDNYTDERQKDGRIVCVKCKPSECPRKCGELLSELSLNGNNIESLRGCTHFRGSLQLNNAEFLSTNSKKTPLLVEQLSILESIREIYGYLYVDIGGNNITDSITSLSFFKNLRVIKGQRLYWAEWAIYIHQTSLHTLGLQSLQSIYRGGLVLFMNRHLCYVNDLNPSIIMGNTSRYRTVVQDNRNQTECEKENLTCSAMCDGGCWGQGPSMCVGCRNYRFNGSCLEKCHIGPRGQHLYIVPEERTAGEGEKFKNGTTRGQSNLTGECGECDEECQGGCTGHGPQACQSCKNMRDLTFNPTKCFNTCLHDRFPTKDNECKPCYGNCEAAIRKAQGNLGIVVTGIVVGVVTLALVVALVGWIIKEKKRRRREKLVAQLIPELETLNTEAADLSHLRLVRESELRRGTCIGSGAFGVVYKGVWIPTGENYKIPVAIKVLNEAADCSLHSELLDEARVMASVCHENCIRIIAVCMGASLQLITPLLPAGCLLNYIRDNKTNIGSRSLLSWSSQIAKGMEYLERRGIVHRDLAARNVLVQSSTKVKITDFGLAKLLPEGSEEFQSGGEKMPVKWLAPESLLERVYTHKSDVWSFGVTLWEMYTYGGRPYERISARDMVDALQDGERLPQPDICTIDVYKILIKCWWLNPKARPNFSELSKEFAKMTEDPGRFLVIEGDKLMRLQSRVHDTVELLRGISGVELPDDPMEIISAEEYLNPVMVGGRNSRGSLRTSRVQENGVCDVEPRKPSLFPRPFAEQPYIAQNSYQNDIRPSHDMTSCNGDVIISSLMTPPIDTSRSLEQIKEVESPEEDDVFIDRMRANGKHISICNGGEQQQHLRQSRPMEEKYDDTGYLQPYQRPQESYLPLVDHDSSDSADAASPLLNSPETNC